MLFGLKIYVNALKISNFFLVLLGPKSANLLKDSFGRDLFAVELKIHSLLDLGLLGCLLCCGLLGGSCLLYLCISLLLS